MSRKPPSARILRLALLLLLLVSCATPPAAPTSTPLPPPPTSTPLPPPTSTPVPPEPTSAAVPSAPTRTPLPPPISPDFPTGTFFHKHVHTGTFCVWQFNEDGTYAFWWNAPSADVSSRKPYVRPAYTGTYTIAGNLYTETSCSYVSSFVPATYAWTFDGHTLAFQVAGEEESAKRQGTYESPLLWTKLE